MSSGERIPLGVADALVDWLRGRLAPANLEVVGSTRRRKPDVGDLEFVSPLTSGVDVLHAILDRVLVRDGVLFPQPDAIGRRITGVAHGFRACSFAVDPPPAIWPHAVQVQVFRYTRENRGWQTVLRTGPLEFGRDVILPAAKARGYAFKDGHVVSAAGAVVPIFDEAAMFALCRLKYVEPQDRKGPA